jgi:hypothetical protein
VKLREEERQSQGFGEEPGIKFHLEYVSLAGKIQRTMTKGRGLNSFGSEYRRALFTWQ